ncbi:glycosyltransferase [Microbacterium sp. NPDC077663]|uniref:glycosyltransferase n=1 Tax=Microbacterium sp. NPDC077663 TaxID=3364189 RepID=UPI0037C70A6E
MTGARILFLSHTHVFGAFRVGSHHYARELARLGAEVVHLSTPISLAHRVTGRVPPGVAATVPRDAHRDADGVTHLVPRTLLPRPWGSFRVARALTRAGIEARFDAILIDQPLLWDDTVRDLSDTLVYRPTDLYPDGLKRSLQERILASADAVVATSGAVLQGLGHLTLPSLVIENGVDLGAFTDTTTDAETRPVVCVYVGALDARFDWQQVRTWATAHPDVPFVIAGPQPAPPASLPQNVELVGPVPYAELPRLLHGARAGLLPLSDDPSNESRSPMKLYEYLAAGLAVVSRETPGIRTDTEAGIHTYDSPETADAALVAALRHPSPNVAGRRAAENHSWAAKAGELATFLAGLAD